MAKSLNLDLELRKAIDRGEDVRIIRCLLNSGANPNQLKPLLHLAVSMQNLEVVKVLLEKNVHVNRLYQKKSALQLAVEKKNLPIIMTLIENGAITAETNKLPLNIVTIMSNLSDILYYSPQSYELKKLLKDTVNTLARIQSYEYLNKTPIERRIPLTSELDIPNPDEQRPNPIPQLHGLRELSGYKMPEPNYAYLNKTLIERRIPLTFERNIPNPDEQRLNPIPQPHGLRELSGYKMPEPNYAYLNKTLIERRIPLTSELDIPNPDEQRLNPIPYSYQLGKPLKDENIKQDFQEWLNKTDIISRPDIRNTDKFNKLDLDLLFINRFNNIFNEKIKDIFKIQVKNYQSNNNFEFEHIIDFVESVASKLKEEGYFEIRNDSNNINKINRIEEIYNSNKLLQVVFEDFNAFRNNIVNPISLKFQAMIKCLLYKVIDTNYEKDIYEQLPAELLEDIIGLSKIFTGRELFAPCDTIENITDENAKTIIDSLSIFNYEYNDLATVVSTGAVPTESDFT